MRRLLGPPDARAGEHEDKPRLPVTPLMRDLSEWAWRLLLLAALGYVLLRLAERLYLVVLPVMAALFLTAVLRPVTELLRRHGSPRAFAVGTVLVGSLAVLVVVGWYVVTRGVDAYPTLIDKLTEAVQRVPVRVQSLQVKQGQLVGLLQEHRSMVLTGVQFVGELATGLVLTALITILLLYDGERIFGWLLGLVRPARRDRVREAAGLAWTRLAGWTRGTVLIGVYHGVVVGITLAVMHVPLVVPLSLLVFVGSFIPIVGAFAFGALAALITFATRGLVSAAVLVAVLVVNNQVESHVLQPFLVGRYVRLHPFVVAVAVTAGGLLEGLPGAILAVPLVAAVHAAVGHLVEPHVPTRNPDGRARAI